METLLQIILPSVIMPVALSVMVWRLIHHYPTMQWSLPVIWLPSYIWINGIPPSAFGEAKDWLWLLLGLSILLNVFFKPRFVILMLLQTLLLILLLIIIAWPVLQYQFSKMLIIEISTVSTAAAVIFYFIGKINTPTSRSLRSPILSLAISSGGLALVVTLTGSLLIGQLAGVIASILFSMFILIALTAKSSNLAINSNNLIPIIQLYFTILVIARIYVELPLGITFLLLLAPLLGLIPKLRYSYVYSAIAVALAISWLMLMADSSSYY